MSFDLPRRARGLRFSGEVRALEPDTAGAARLGRKRPPREAHAEELAPTPVVGAPARTTRIATPARLEAMRGAAGSMDDEALTLALDRDAIATALLPDAPRERPREPKPGPGLPVPHFRSKQEVARHRAEPTVIVAHPRKGGSLPLGIWLFAAMIAAMVSFHFAPQAKEGIEQAVRTLDPR